MSMTSPLTILGKYVVKNSIGAGSFGTIYNAVDSESQADVAIKLEPIKNKHPQLEYESRLYQQLAGGAGIPLVHTFGRDGDFNVLVMDKLGQDLESLFNRCSRKFSIKTVAMLGEQMVERLEYIHSKNFIHRDIKPDNFLMGMGPFRNVVFLVDFGLAKCYRHESGEHIKYRDDKSLTGTARYASISTHKGHEQSRKDDLEALGYVLVYFLKGSLPWQGLGSSVQNKTVRIGEIKGSVSATQLCEGLPAELTLYLEYCRNLSFQDRPNYTYLRGLFRGILERHNMVTDYVYDWDVPVSADSAPSVDTSDVAELPVESAANHRVCLME